MRSLAGLGPFLAVPLLAVGLALPARADDPATFKLTLKDHRFEPAQLTVPAGARFHVVVHNADTTPAEMESRELDVEKVLSPGRETIVRLGPLKPGSYAFADEFHHEATGTIVVVAALPAP